MPTEIFQNIFNFRFHFYSYLPFGPFHSAARQSERGQVWDIINMRRMHIFVNCVKYHEYEDDVKYFLKWFTFQPVSPSYCSPDPVTGNLPFDCIDIIDVRESYRVVRDFCHLVNESKLCSIFKRFRFGFHQTLRDTEGKYVTSFESNWTIEIFRNNFLLKIDWIKVSPAIVVVFERVMSFLGTNLNTFK